jgi:RNA polymerase sigma-70 factor (ECF subfamily)
VVGRVADDQRPITDAKRQCGGGCQRAGTTRNLVQSSSAEEASLVGRTAVHTLDNDASLSMQALYDAYSEPLLRYLRSLTFGEMQKAEDLLQETMLQAWRHRHELAPDVSALRPWLFTVARRRAIDAARAKRIRPEEMGWDISRLPALEDSIERLHTTHVIRSGLARLSPKHRAVIVAVYLCDREPAEVAHYLGVPEGTVKSRLYYALRALRAAIEEPARH